ncbi:MAG: hypothetical protein QOJ29_5356 [Thermoleophilaceae bacterium]|nr:hypothetical protein [Thermoleophilaceae bacterium]
MFAGSFLEVALRLLRLASFVAVAFIVAGLIGFLTDEVRDTSTVQATRIPDPGSGRVVTTTVDISEPDPSPAIEKVREDEHAGGREVIDDVGDVLMAPFSFLIKDSRGSVKRLLYSALALLLYGLLLQLLADFMRRQSDGSRRAAFAAREKADADERRKSGTYASPS